MKTLRTTLPVVAALLLASCGNRATKSPASNAETVTVAAEKALAATEMPGYFLKNSYRFAADTAAYFVFENQDAFDAVVNIARTMGNAPLTPDFDKTAVGAIALKPTNRPVRISVGPVEQTSKTVATVYFTVTTGSETLSYTQTPFRLFNFPKSDKLKTVRFVSGGRLVHAIALD